MRKPASLSETLRGSGSINLDPEAERSLARAGFHVVTISDPANPGQKSYQLRSNEGEIAVTMKDGVYYVLRFGQIAGMASEEAKEAKKDKQADEKTAEKKPESSTADVNRYLFVMAELRPEVIDKPTYEQLRNCRLSSPRPVKKAGAVQGRGKKPRAKVKKPEQPKPMKRRPEQSKAGEKAQRAESSRKPAKRSRKRPKADAKSDEAKPEGKPEAGKEKAAAGEESKPKSRS